jgi:ribosome-associated protein
VSIIADYFIIATAANGIQLNAIANATEEFLEKHGIKLNHMEGYRESKWVLLDFGVIIIHLFLQEERELYNLERIWGDAERIGQEN